VNGWLHARVPQRWCCCRRVGNGRKGSRHYRGAIHDGQASPGTHQGERQGADKEAQHLQDVEQAAVQLAPRQLGQQVVRGVAGWEVVDRVMDDLGTQGTREQRKQDRNQRQCMRWMQE
jgi:hypothetical protein